MSFLVATTILLASIRWITRTVMVIDDGSDDEREDLNPEAAICKTLELAAKLERLSIEFGSKNSNDLGLNQELGKFRSHLKLEAGRLQECEKIHY